MGLIFHSESKYVPTPVLVIIWVVVLNFFKTSSTYFEVEQRGTG